LFAECPLPARAGRAACDAARRPCAPASHAPPLCGGQPGDPGSRNAAAPPFERVPMEELGIRLIHS
jgi:hypothetical protein